jgi:hypothetical protein
MDRSVVITLIIVVIFIIAIIVVTVVIFDIHKPKNQCPVGTNYVNGNCYPNNTPCSSSNSCPSGYICGQSGGCVQSSPCNSSNPCPAGYTCQNGACVQNGSCGSGNIYQIYCISNGSVITLTNYNGQALGVCDPLNFLPVAVTGAPNTNTNWIVELSEDNQHISFKNQATGGYLQLNPGNGNSNPLIVGNYDDTDTYKWFSMSTASNAGYIALENTWSLGYLGTQSGNYPITCGGNNLSLTFANMASTNNEAWWTIGYISS